METHWTTYIIIGLLIYLILEVRVLNKSLRDPRSFGFASPKDWVSLTDLQNFRKMLIHWADKNDIFDDHLDTIAKYLGVNPRKWEEEKAGREITLREAGKWDHSKPLP